MNEIDLYSKARVSKTLSIIFGILTLLLSIGSIYLLVNYLDQKNNVDSKINLAVAESKRDLSAKMEKEFAEREKEPNLQFLSPDDLGRLNFKYPKTWSVAVVETDNVYEADFHPKTVVFNQKKDAKLKNTFSDKNLKKIAPNSDVNLRYALRVIIEKEDYDNRINAYSDIVKAGKLKSTAFKVGDDVIGTRFDGSFNDNIRGSAVVIKNRDKVITIQTDIESLTPDFNKLIETITLNK